MWRRTRCGGGMDVKGNVVIGRGKTRKGRGGVERRERIVGRGGVVEG